MERSGFEKTSPSLARRGGDARRRRRRRQPFRRERLRRASSTTLRAVTTGRSRARSQPTIHMPTSLPTSHRSRGARVTCTLVLLFGGGVHTVFSPTASLFFLLYTDECRKIDRALLLLVITHTPTAPRRLPRTRRGSRSVHSSPLARALYIQQKTRVASDDDASSDRSTRLGSLRPHSDLFARARLPPARVLGVVNRPKIAPRADVPVASVAPRGIGDDDSPPLFARFAPR